MKKSFSKKPHPRKIYIVNQRFQKDFLKNMLFLNIGVSAIFYISQTIFFWNSYRLGRDLTLPPDHIYFKFLIEQQHLMNVIMVATVFTVSALILSYGLVYSNKIAGPLFNLQRYLRNKVSGKEQPPLKFRKDDNFQELAHAVNDYITHVEKASTSKAQKKAA